MALESSSGVLPKNAVPLTTSEALNYQWDQIMNWPDKMDVWPYRYGFSAQAILSTTSALYINNKFRKHLKLRHQGFAPSLLTMIVIPPMFTVVLHSQLVSADIILGRRECSLCSQYRAAAVQVACGVIYPLTLSPIANLMFALHHGTTRLPYWKDFSSHLDLWLKVTKPIGKSILYFTIAHALLAGFVTYGEFESLYTIRTKLSKNRETINEEITQ